MTVDQREVEEALMHEWFGGRTGPITGPAALARKEGWDIWDCSGSSYGRWQVNRVDEAEEGDAQIDDDAEVWRMILEGSGPHHVYARDFIREHNPMHWWEICRSARLGIDKTKLSPELLVECAAAVLGPVHPEYPE